MLLPPTRLVDLPAEVADVAVPAEPSIFTPVKLKKNTPTAKTTVTVPSSGGSGGAPG